MNQFENDTNGAMVDTTPLFASSLMALYYVLRKNFNERRVPRRTADNSSQAEKK